MSRKARPQASQKGGHGERAEPGDDGQEGEHPPGLTARQATALDALLRGQTNTAAALAAGVSERTLRRWGYEPAFRSALMEARRDAFAQAVGLTARYAPVAVGTLVKVMNDQMASPSARVTAAAVLLKFGREGLELDDLAARIEQLEQAASMLGTTAAAKPSLRLVEEADG
jgi:hypothetical protein